MHKPHRLLPVLLLACPLLASAQVHYDPSPSAVVQLDSGKLQGAEPAAGVRAYLGIPYARPPLGPLRWRPPQPFGPLSVGRDTTRMAVAHGAPCAQQKFGWNNGSAEHGTEDCLFLNVWAPSAGKGHPVMVYIHGGSNTAGSAAEELSNGLQLVPRGVVLVTLDYRLGVFGFFRTPGLDRESGYGGSGDYGLMDQIAALRWVQRNIAAFGGDPADVTLFGQSAGAVDTGLLMASPLARGLFQRALEESGQVLGLMPTASKQQSEQAWAPVAKALGTNPSALRQASTAEVLAAEENAPKPPSENFWGYRGASVDGHVLPALPAHIFAEGGEAPVPLVIGSNVQEIVPNGQSATQTDHLIEYAVGAQLAPALEAIYAKPPADLLEGDEGDRFQTDRDFRCAVRQVAAWHASHGFPTFVYQFDRSAGSARAAKHSSELRFVFGFPDSAVTSSHPVTAEDITVSAELQTLWTTFARTGAPTPAGPAEAGSLPDWPSFNMTQGDYLHFASGSTLPVVAQNLGGASCSVLKGRLLPGSR
jgi:para-nitrobenzyl esterase